MSLDLKVMEWNTAQLCLLCKSQLAPHLLRHIYGDEAEEQKIRAELSSWNTQLTDSDSKFVCLNCARNILIFLKMKEEFLDSRACAQVKTEINKDDGDDTRFIYVDDLPEDYDGTPFPTPHYPQTEKLAIKEEPGVVKIEKTADNTALVIKPDPDNVFKTEVANEKRLRCGICNHVSFTQESYRRHSQIHVAKDRICQGCGKILRNATLAKLKSHMKFHRARSCEKCSFLCNSKRSMDHHVKMEHTTVECSVCKEVVLMRQKEAHFLRHERCGEWICRTCCKVFDTEGERAQHMVERHGFDENDEPEVVYETFICARCDFTTSTEDQLRLHNAENPDHVIKTPKVEFASDGEIIPPKTEDVIERDMPPRNVEDDINSELVDAVVDFSEHKVENGYASNPLNFIHEGISPQKLPEYTMEGHIDGMRALAIESEESFEYEPPSYIDEAEMMEESETQRNISMSSSTTSASETNFGAKQNEYYCTQCAIQFTNQRDLQEHLSTHTAKPVFTCRICGKEFALSIQLNAHKKKHSSPL